MPSWCCAASIVIGFGVGVSGDAEPEGWLLSLYSLIAIFVNSRVLAFTIDGASYDKLLFVISDFHSDEFREFIIGELNRSATYIKAHGMYSRDEKEMIFLVVSRNEVKGRAAQDQADRPACVSCRDGRLRYLRRGLPRPFPKGRCVAGGVAAGVVSAAGMTIRPRGAVPHRIPFTAACAALR